ncbi:MAG TPA: GNAT family protein [Dehalococcoidia bacterium]|nr:GNAT family protein [Dehalococcoidia bacterium]
MQFTTEHLLLREFREDDWRAILAYQSDPRYLRFYPLAGRSEADVRAFVGMFLAQQAEEPRWKWQLAIVLPEQDRLIGNCGLRLDAPAARTANIGYELDPRQWGRGYATEAMRAMLRFGFEELGLHRVWAWCIAENTASARALERLGLLCEGRQREQEWFKGRWWDTLLYGILEGEWRGRAQT